MFYFSYEFKKNFFKQAKLTVLDRGIKEKNLRIRSDLGFRDWFEKELVFLLQDLSLFADKFVENIFIIC